MDACINMIVEAEQLSPSENLIQQELDWQGCFSENSEVTHSSSSNVNNEGLKLHIKQEQQIVPIKEELVILSEINYYDPQDEPLDQNALNSFLWPSYLKKEIEESVDTQEKSGEKSQFNEILKSKNPIVLLEDVRHTHKKILEQCQSEDYRKKLRQKSPREDCSFHEKSVNKGKKLRPRLSKTSVSKDFADDGDLEKRSINNESKVSGSRNEQNNSSKKIELENICQQNKNSFSFKLKSNSSLETLKKDNLNIKNFKCNYCSYQTKYERSYNAHCAKHKNIKLFKCNSCDFETNYKSDLIRHNLKHCSEVSELNSTRNCDNQLKSAKYFSLSLSEVILLIYNKRKLLDENTSIPSLAEPIKCSECNFEAEDQICMDLHSQIHSEVHKCPECSYKSTDTETFKDHLIKIHIDDFISESESVIYSLRKRSTRQAKKTGTSVSESVHYTPRKRSRQPNKTDTDESSDEDHSGISGKHKHEDSDFEDELVDDSDFEDELVDDSDFEDELVNITEYCDEPRRKRRCNANRKNYNFVAHCLHHANEKVFKCDHCDFKTNYKRLLRNHKLNCTKNQENILNNCFNKAIDENVDYHSLSLSEMINLICNQDKSLDHNTSDETITEVLRCLECPFETGNQNIFNLHSQIHVEVKKCTECNFESKDTETFKNHIIGHFKHKNINEENLFKCCDCSYKTKYKTSFDAHCAKHKNIKLFKCDDCDFESNYKRHFVSHNLNRCSMKAKLNSNENCVSECFSIAIDENVNYHLLSLSEIINLICNNDKSLDINTTCLATKEVLKCLECIFETGNQKIFKLHSQIHVEVKKCTECSFETNCLEKFKNHLITHLDCCGNKSDSPSHSCRNSKLSVSGIYENVLRGNTDKNMKWEVQECLNRIKTLTKAKSQRKYYACDKCSYKADSFADFLSHKLVHNKEKSYFVDITNHFDNLKDYSFSDIISMICNDENEVNQDTNLDSETKLHKCSRCSFECNDEQQLSEHLSSHSTEEKFICSQCSFESINQSDLDSHLQTHSTFKCSKCLYECSEIDGLNLHSCEPNSDKVFRCSTCNFETKKEKHFTLHSQLHAKFRKCTECSYSHHSKDKFKEHLKSHFPTKLYTCTKCSYKTNFIKKLKVHLFNHTNIRVFTCPQCDYKTNHKGNMKNHLETHIEVKTYRCSECDYSTATSASLKEHILNHSQIKQFLCGECDYGCNNKARMKEHVKQHSNERQYKCSHCDFSTKYKKNLILHKAKHTGQFSYSCSQCDYKCIYKNLLKTHSLIHAKTKRYKCPECSYQCNYNLKLHMINMHSKTKMYKCSECKYESNHRSNFLTHLRTHSSDRNYSCSECSFTSKRKDNLKMHLMTHLKEKLFKCSHCDYKCTHKYQLKRHMLIH